jgi:hypothetical protein
MKNTQKTYCVSGSVGADSGVTGAPFEESSETARLA